MTFVFPELLSGSASAPYPPVADGQPLGGAST
jgi:hypothetical protein